MIGAVVLGYALVLVLPQFTKSSKPLPRVFNSMLDHMLQGRFDIDPAVIGNEGFLRAGSVYAYWGIMPAVLRLPVTILPNWRNLNFTVAYCILALALMATVKLWTVRYMVRRHDGMPRWVARAMYLVIGLSGAQICFLKPSVFQEVCLWAGLFGAVFVASAVVAQHRGLGERERLVMAAAAGAALLTRVSTGIGLIAAFALVLAVEMVGNHKDRRGQVGRSVRPVLLLILAGIVTGWVNYGRWGDPLTFADYDLYLFNRVFPDRVARTAAYGLFNIERIPFGIVYYFLPVWVLRGGDGQLLFDSTRSRLIDAAELPPSSFLLTDPLLLMLGGIAIWRWVVVRKAAGDGTLVACDVRRRGLAIAAGLSLPPLLMLTAISMCFRYRMDFYPVMEFLAFSGLAMVGRGEAVVRPRVVWVLTVVSIVASVVVAIAYFASRFGPAQRLIGDGIGEFYLGRLGLI